MRELDCKESWAPKEWWFWTVVLKKILESPLDCTETKPVRPKGNQSWIFFGRTDVEAKTPILWPPDAKNWLLRKDPDTGKNWRREEKGSTEDEIVGWHHWWTWVWASSGTWWWTGKPGVWQPMGLQRVGHDWVTELNWPDLKPINFISSHPENTHGKRKGDVLWLAVGAHSSYTTSSTDKQKES